MFDQISEQDKRNSFWLSIVFLVLIVLLVLLSYWFYKVIDNDVVEATKIVQDDDSETPSTIDDDKTVVQVANATSTTGLASELSRRLETKNYVALNPFNIDNQSISQVYFQTDPVSRQNEAKEIGSLFGVKEDQIVPFPDDLEIDDLNKETEVFLIIGRDIRL